MIFFMTLLLYHKIKLNIIIKGIDKFHLFIKCGSIFITWNLPSKFNSTEELIKESIDIVIALDQQCKAFLFFLF